MGTRADFYVGRGEKAEWLGSIGWDGCPDGIEPENTNWDDGKHLFDATTEAEFRERLEQFFDGRDDVSRPADGWPWPWNDSGTTDYAYAFDGGKVWGTFSDFWWPANEEPDSEDSRPKGASYVSFPDMSQRKKVTMGKRSGLIVISAKT